MSTEKVATVTERQRNEMTPDVILTSPLFNTGDPEIDRHAAIDWGRKAYEEEVGAFTPYAVGPSLFIDHGCHWPADGDKLVELNEEKGNLPTTADLGFGVVPVSTYFYGIKRTPEGGFFAIILAGNVAYANKIEEPAPEPAAEGEDNQGSVGNGGLGGDTHSIQI